MTHDHLIIFRAEFLVHWNKELNCGRLKTVEFLFSWTILALF